MNAEKQCEDKSLLHIELTKRR